MALHSLIIFGLVRRVLVICGEYYTRQMFINLLALLMGRVLYTTIPLYHSTLYHSTLYHSYLIPLLLLMTTLYHSTLYHLYFLPLGLLYTTALPN